jgi:branched-chain amino acid transport system permease protein
VIALIGLAVCVALPFLVSTQLLTVMISALLMAYLAQCWNIAAGYAGQFSLGHSFFFGAGAYTTAMLFTKFGISPWVGMLGGALLMGIAGLLIGFLVFRFRIKGVYFAVVTIGLAEIAKGLADNWNYIGGPVGILYIMQNDPSNYLFTSRKPFYYIALFGVLTMLLLTKLIVGSKMGQYFLAIREDEDAAEAAGVDTRKYKIVAIALSAALTALGGTFYAQFQLYITPETVFTFEHQLNMMLGTMIGGAGTVLGPVVGALSLSALAEALRNLPFEEGRVVASLSHMVFAVLMITLIVYLPGGIMSLAARYRWKP